MRRAVLAAAFLIATPASAQSVDVTVRTDTDPANVAPRPCVPLQSLLIGTPFSVCEARAVAAKRKKVGELLAAGDCPGAVRLAIQAGDLKYAAQVREFCASQPTQPGPPPPP